MSNIIEFPVKVVDEAPEICSNCVNYMSGPLGSYCAHWREEIADETIATDCGGFERY